MGIQTRLPFSKSFIGDAFGEGLGHTPTALGPQPDVRNYGWRDYGLRVGIWRIFDMMDELQWPMCHLINASVCEEIPQITERIRRRGDEVIGHGYTNSERQSDMDEATEAAMIAHATKTLASSCGRRPYGWMGPWISETAVTPDLLRQRLGQSLAASAATRFARVRSRRRRVRAPKSALRDWGMPA